MRGPHVGGDGRLKALLAFYHAAPMLCDVVRVLCIAVLVLRYAVCVLCGGGERDVCWRWQCGW
jgi:hypothetical protein